MGSRDAGVSLHAGEPTGTAEDVGALCTDELVQSGTGAEVDVPLTGDSDVDTEPLLNAVTLHCLQQ